MTDDELAFIRAAAAQPDDDTCRLVYADWLEERGGVKFCAQAAFVRLQVARARLDLFDPDRAPLLRQETELARRHRRGWNGRVHRYFTRSGLREKVAVHRGAVRSWDYHRGMIDRVTVAANGLDSHAALALSVGPVQCLAVAGWRAPTADLRAALARLLPRLKALALIGPPSSTLLEDLSQIDGLDLVPLLDLRSLDCGGAAGRLLALACEGRISPVVLFRRSVVTPFPYTAYRRGYTGQLSRDELHVIDPFGHWPDLRRWYSDLNGTVLAPIVFRGNGR
jgi:uncharacterized protein (TIGR02996 family)